MLRVSRNEYVASDCDNIKSKKKTLNTIWKDDTSEGDDENPKSEKLDTSKEKLIAFMASTGSATQHVSSDDVTDHDDNESEEELD